MGAKQSAEMAQAIRLVLKEKLTNREAANRTGLHISSIRRAIKKEQANAKK